MRILPSLTVVGVAVGVVVAAWQGIPVAAATDDGQQILTVDHYVRVPSTVPSLAGQTSTLYVRERVQAGTALRGGAGRDRVVLFIHGAGTPAEVAFDVPYQDYSWMAYLARAGYDTFAMDVTGIGRSTRPSPMQNPCNLAQAQQLTFVPSLLAAPCPPVTTSPITTIQTDWDDIGAVVDYVRALRHVETVDTVAWSLGGPRSGGYAAQHPEKIRRMVMLAPAYNPSAPATAPATLPSTTAAFNTQSLADFDALWGRQTACPAQWTPETHDAVWGAMLASDPVGATWGTGVRRAPSTPTWGWNQATVAASRIPTLVVAGAHDGQVSPDRVRQLYADLGSTEKVFVDLACSSHNAMWETHHLDLFRASLEWLSTGRVNGVAQGLLKIGY